MAKSVIPIHGNGKLLEGGHNTIDMVGRKFGRLTVITRAGSDKRGEAVWSCVCDCGKPKTTTGNRLRKGLAASCGCLSIERTVSMNKTHGKTNSRVYRIWNSMLQRCANQKNLSFKHYGGRGIKVCERWHDFTLFLADMGEPPQGLSIDRINNNGDYEPGNCRWASNDDQANNKRSSRRICLGGITLTLTQHINRSGLVRETVYKRLQSGFSIEDALAIRDFRIEKRKSVQV